MTSTRATHRRNPSAAVAAKAPRRSGRAPRTPLAALQQRAGNRATNELLGSGGRPLEPGLRGAMEQRFGTGFADVRVHADAEAAGRAHAEGALAFTQGADIFFGEGKYRPGTEAGRGLVAHELAHVIQQTRNAGPAGFSSGLEAEAEAAAAGTTPVTGSAPAGAIQRATKEKQPPPVVVPEQSAPSVVGSEQSKAFAPAGSGFAAREFALNVDESLAVGEPGISEAESMRRALDLKRRQFLDQSTNSATKGARREVHGRSPLAPTSVKENPSALISRPTLGGVKEWDELSALIMDKVKDRLPGKTPGQVKEILNAAIREEIKSPTTEPGKIISEALSQQMRVPADELFQGETMDKLRWKGGGEAAKQTPAAVVEPGGVSEAAVKESPPVIKKPLGKMPGAVSEAAVKESPPVIKKPLGKMPGAVSEAAVKESPPVIKKPLGKMPGAVSEAAVKESPPVIKKPLGKMPGAVSEAAVKESPPVIKKPLGKMPGAVSEAAVKESPPVIKRPLGKMPGAVSEAAVKESPPVIKKTMGRQPLEVASPDAPGMTMAEAIEKGIAAPINQDLGRSPETVARPVRLREGGGTGSVGAGPESASDKVSAPRMRAGVESAPAKLIPAAGMGSRGTAIAGETPKVSAREMPGMFTGKEVASLAEAGRKGAPTRTDRRLMMAGKSLGVALQAVGAIGDVMSALQFIDMAESGLKGEGFVLREGLANARELRTQSSASLEAQGQFHTEIAQALGPGGGVLATSLRDPVQAARDAGDLDEKRFALEAQLSSIDDLLPRIEERAQLAKASKNALAAMLSDPVSVAIWTVAHGGTSMAVAELQAMAIDAENIHSELTKTAEQLRALRPQVVEDMELIGPWQQALQDVAGNGRKWRVPGTDVVVDMPPPKP